jgi:hypothetical protein
MGLIRRIGAGGKTNIWDMNWIPRRALTPCATGVARSADVGE